MNSRIRPAPLNGIQDNGAAPEENIPEANMPTPVANQAAEEPSSPMNTASPPLSPNSQFQKVMGGVEEHMNKVTANNRSAKKMSAGVASALNAFMKGSYDHKVEEKLNHVCHELLLGARLMKVRMVRERLLLMPEYASYVGAPKEPMSPQASGNQFKVSLVLDPYGLDERFNIIVSPEMTLFEIYKNNPIVKDGTSVPFDRVGIMIHGMQAPVGYKGFQIQEFDLGDDIGTIFIAQLVEKFTPDPVLDSPSASAYKNLNPAWYVKG
jgi:hypothetical protein